MLHYYITIHNHMRPVWVLGNGAEYNLPWVDIAVRARCNLWLQTHIRDLRCPKYLPTGTTDICGRIVKGYAAHM